MPRGYFTHSLFNLRRPLIRHLAKVRRNGKAFPFQLRTSYIAKFLLKFFLCIFEDWKKLWGHLFPQPAGPDNIEAVTARVNNPFDAHLLAQVLQVAAAEDGDRHFGSERSQYLTH